MQWPLVRVIDRPHQVPVRIVAGAAQHVAELVQHHGGEIAPAEAVVDHVDEAAVAVFRHTAAANAAGSRAKKW